MSGQMNVEGVSVSNSTLEKAFSYHLPERFTFSDMSAALVKCGVDANTAYRAADRFLQKKRRSGEIEFSGKKWSKSIASKAQPETPAPDNDRHEREWQDISTAPKDGTVIDLWGINHLHYAKAGTRIVNVAWGPVRDWMGHEREDWQHGRGDDFEPTHWMPLPPKPHHFNQEGK